MHFASYFTSFVFFSFLTHIQDKARNSLVSYPRGACYKTPPLWAQRCSITSQTPRQQHVGWETIKLEQANLGSNPNAPAYSGGNWWISGLLQSPSLMETGDSTYLVQGQEYPQSLPCLQGTHLWFRSWHEPKTKAEEKKAFVTTSPQTSLLGRNKEELGRR